ncbi:MAG: amidohydrolase family protein [Pseudomarimonas sp.]
MKARIALLLAMTLALPAAAQELLIRNASVHTQTSAGTLQASDVRIRDGRIVEIGKGLAAAAGGQVIEADGKALTPGLFGGLSALGLEEISLEPSTVDSAYTPGTGDHPTAIQPRPEFDVAPAFNPESAVIGVNRVEGITFTLLAPNALPGGTIFAGIGSVARLHGRADAVAPSSRTLLVDLGADSATLAGNSRAAQYMLLAQAVREARPDADMRDSDFGLLTASGRDVLAGFLNGGRMAFKVDRVADIRQALVFCKRHGCRPVIVGGVEAWRVASELAAAKVPVVLDPLQNLPASFDRLGASMENAARLHAAGVPIAFTNANDGTHNARKLRQSAGNAVAHGLPWDAALGALTSGPAEIFGVGASLGRIAVGHQADLVLWSGDPLEVTSHASQVWIGGVAQPTRSRQTELRDRYHPTAR